MSNLEERALQHKQEGKEQQGHFQTIDNTLKEFRETLRRLEAKVDKILDVQQQQQRTEPKIKEPVSNAPLPDLLSPPSIDLKHQSHAAQIAGHSDRPHAQQTLTEYDPILPPALGHGIANLAPSTFRETHRQKQMPAPDVTEITPTFDKGFPTDIPDPCMFLRAVEYFFIGCGSSLDEWGCRTLLQLVSLPTAQAFWEEINHTPDQPWEIAFYAFLRVVPPGHLSP
ncbi:hypothetical protein H4R20_003081 [Coemansia guatemalensis]|uniref:Uncharacterized protein n=1 Tax=Coemansia guatemalensis TaxID=2761395 RepID=A0A9W8I1A6_9FUNG|nr:hypothetical protein H4R20_003081 [Coemansia guatemalensis]